MHTTMDATPMELDDLKQAWQALDARLQQQNTLQLGLLREKHIDSMASSLRPLFWGQLIQMLFGIATIVAGVWLWKTFTAITPVFVCGLVLHLYGITTTAAAGIVIGQIAGIDRSLPVLKIQQRLARLRKTYLISGMAVGLPWWVLWMLPLIVIASLQGHAQGDPSLPLWLWVTLAGCFAGLLGTWAFHRWSRSPGREALAKRLEDGAAGGSLRKAQAELDALNAYCEE